MPPLPLWPPALGYLRGLCAADEVASTLRHQALNEIAGVGALLYRLRRRLAAHALDPEVTNVLDAIDARLAGGPGRLATRFLRTSTGAGGHVDLTELARSTVTSLNAAAVVDADGPVLAVVDPDEIRVAIGCLLENAADVASSAEAIRVEVSQDSQRRVVGVRDDGPALEASLLEKLLDPFFTTHAGRAGLGLKIARRIAQRWNGELLISPGEMRGLLVELVLPAA